MHVLHPDPALPTFVTARADRRQRRLAGALCLVFGLATAALLPVADRPMPAIPAFVPVYQSALCVIYGLTTYLFFVQYRRTRSVPLLMLGAGSLYVALIVLAQLLSFPNVLAPGRLLGSGPETTTWLWTFWHLGPPLFALLYALLEGGEPGRRGRVVPPDLAARAGWLAAGVGAAGAGLGVLASTHFVSLLPRLVEGDDFRLLTTSGVGPGVTALTLLALALLWRSTRLATVLQLWLAVSLLLLVLDNLVTLPGGARGTIGWAAGRLEALVAGLILLLVYLREVDFLYARAETTAREREAQRAELQTARDSFALALEAAEMGDWEIDLRSGASRRNPRHDAIFGHAAPLPHWDAETLLRHVVPEDRPALRGALGALGQTDRLYLHCRIRRAGDGALRWIALRARVSRDALGNPAVLTGLVMDTTERNEAEERLAQAQKMEAIGQITGGVAHDFNNLLTIIVGNLDMIVRRPEDAQRVARLAGSGLQAARRGAEVTEKLLAFSRRQVVRPRTVNPNRLLGDFRGLLERAVGATVEVRFDLDPGLDPVRLDPGQFENAILNLAVNARDAMPGGGLLTMRTANAAVTVAGAEDGPDLPSGAYVRVAVSDTGHGMEPDTLARAFDPFFTTKEVGKGTGLGLSQVYGFVRQAGGLARIRSAPGEGTTIELYLPRSQEAETEQPVETGFPLRRATEGETVLVVEDEPAVLEMAVESLTELGYRTLTATRAAAALERLRSPERIDILFSDVVMPAGMNGVQLAVEARRVRPGLRVLLTSGYTGTALADHSVPDDLPLLSKPYLREQLAEKLRIVMGR